MSKDNDKPVTNGELRKSFKWQDVAVVCAILSGFVGGYIHLISEAKAQSDAGIVPLAKQVAQHDQDILDIRQENRNIKQDVHELQVDIRELYKTVKTGQRSERLEAPPINSDGGH